ncbi:MULTISPECIES: hypothetical protein [Nostocales]|uniref:Uncharacterized protein n=3 Tax=Nostocales TaxID=1161 RepID=A0A0C1MXX9_9CYAN|nr:hypothetical protein [Tolypothrix bouteillei]KAF3889376.1 hypothetical protein DA73_0400030775 [Tolypothrix bouteillei VB521301]
MNNTDISEVGKQVSFAYVFFNGYGFFPSKVVANWLGLESLPDWEHDTILDLLAVDQIAACAKLDNQLAQKYLTFFNLRGTHTEKFATKGFGLNVEILKTVVNCQKAIAPPYIPLS